MATLREFAIETEDKLQTIERSLVAGSTRALTGERRHTARRCRSHGRRRDSRRTGPRG